jgi:hypothetical protein
MNELLSLLSAAVSYAMESPQNFVVVCGFVGWVGLFVQPLPKRTYAKPTPSKGRKQKAATNRKNRTVQPVKKAKAKKETAKKTEWTKPPIYTPADIFRIEEMFRRGRGEQAY